MSLNIVPSSLHDEQNGYLETIGRVTGVPRLTEIWFAVDPDGARIFLLSGYHTNKDWVRNLTKHPCVRFKIGDRWFSGQAQQVTGPPEALDQARALLANKYYGGDLDAGESWARTGTPFMLAIAADDTSSSPLDNEPRTGFIETTGRVSGEPRETQIGFATADGGIFVIASKGSATDWVKNLLRSPRVRFRIGETWHTARAHVATDEREIERVRAAMLTKYEGGKIGTEWIRTGLPIAIDVADSRSVSASAAGDRCPGNS